jgi:hypothetical protein
MCTLIITILFFLKSSWRSDQELTLLGVNESSRTKLVVLKKKWKNIILHKFKDLFSCSLKFKDKTKN